jgi:hypothetical protein
LKETRKAFADFHGELVLLEHWTSLNYTALVKILKKHDKRSRVRLRSPFLVSALQQPFYSTEVLTELIKKTELRFRKLHELTSEAEAAERLTNGERSAEKTAATEKRNKTHTKTPPALARTRAAISCWDGMKDEDSVKRPFGDGHTGILKASEPASKKVKGVRLCAGDEGRLSPGLFFRDATKRAVAASSQDVYQRVHQSEEAAI